MGPRFSSFYDVKSQTEYSAQHHTEARNSKHAISLRVGLLLLVIFEIGGWAGGGSDSTDFIKNCDLMWKQSVWSSAISASLASKHLKTGGCLILPGAKAGLDGTPGMIG